MSAAHTHRRLRIRRSMQAISSKLVLGKQGLEKKERKAAVVEADDIVRLGTREDTDLV